jgi:hypothetical protein
MSADPVDEGVVLRFEESATKRALLLEDDGRVAYAYLLEDERIVGDVWLYNVGETPDRVDWSDRDAMPFQNPRAFCAPDRMDRLTPESKVTCEWFGDRVQLMLDRELVAVLVVGAKPGWSRFAVQPGPLARPISELEMK